MSGQITTVDPRYIEFESMCYDLADWLTKVKDFDYLTNGRYRKVVQQGTLQIDVSLNDVSRTVVCVVSYRKNDRKGKPEYIETDRMREVMEFISDFDFE